MKKNMGSADKLIRLIIAVILLVAFFTDTVRGTAGMVLLVIGAVFFATGIVGICPLYTLLKINTCKTKN